MKSLSNQLQHELPHQGTHLYFLQIWKNVLDAIQLKMSHHAEMLTSTLNSTQSRAQTY